METRNLCFYCSKYKGFHPCVPKQNRLQCNDDNNWEYYERKVVMVYIPCAHCTQNTGCSVTDTCNQNSKWPDFKKREDYKEISIHDGFARKKT